jgi:hypothetical protein
MYVIHRRPRTAIQEDGSTRTTPGETRTFATAAGLLRFALNEQLFDHRTGGRAYPTRVHEVWLGRVGTRAYGLINPFTRWEVTYDHIEAMRRAQHAYNERLHYWREVEPEWRPNPDVGVDGVIGFADNSTELQEINKYGGRRHRMLVAPHGDACF